MRIHRRNEEQVTRPSMEPIDQLPVLQFSAIISGFTFDPSRLHYTNQSTVNSFSIDMPAKKGKSPSASLEHKRNGHRVIKDNQALFITRFG